MLVHMLRWVKHQDLGYVESMAALRNDPHGRGLKTGGWIPPVLSDHPLEAHGRELVRVDRLGERGVIEVATAEHGVLAVGLRADGMPFAVSNVCRHQFGKLGRGRVADDGCLECPWHRAHFDVTDGAMREGPKGRLFGFRPYSAMIRAVADQLRLTSYPVVVRDGAIWLRD